MAQLTFNVQNQIITRTDSFQPVAMSQNYLEAEFTFSEDWGTDDKVAIFKAGCNTYEVTLDAENTCTVPWEALVSPGIVYVSVYSGDRITASRARVQILQTGYTETVNATSDPSVDVYQSLLTRMDEIDDDVVNQVDTALETAKESGEFDGPQGVGIQSVTYNENYTLTLTLTDGQTTTTGSLRGAPGDDYVLTDADREEIADLVPASDWDAEEGTGGYIANKPPIEAGTGNGSITGTNAEASGNGAVAFGSNNVASGSNSATVSGANSKASGFGSFTAGTGCIGSGAYSSCFGSSVNNFMALTGAANATSYTYTGILADYIADHIASGYGMLLFGGALISITNIDTSTKTITTNVTLSETALYGQLVNLVLCNASTGNASFANGSMVVSAGAASHAEGTGTIANHAAQHVFGQYNIEDASTASATAKGTYIEIVGNGTTSARSNARTLDWDGNEVLSGKLTVGVGPVNDMDVATKQYTDNLAVKSETVTGTTPTITGVANTRYYCGEVSTISITPPESGIIDVIFTSGATASVLTIPNTVKFPSGFDATSLLTNTTYEINILDGVYGAVMSWAV